MQLPGSAFEWSLDLDDAFKGESKVKTAQYGHFVMHGMTYHADLSRCTLDIAPHTIDAQTLGQKMDK